MSRYKLELEFDNINDLNDFVKMAYELEVLKKKSIIKKDEIALGYSENFNEKDCKNKD